MSASMTSGSWKRISRLKSSSLMSGRAIRASTRSCLRSRKPGNSVLGAGTSSKCSTTPWILSTKAFDGSWEYRGCNRPGTSNLQFARRRIGQKFNVPYSLLQLIECRPSARKQSATVDRGLDPLRIAIKQAHRKHVLKAGDNVRNGGLSQSEL